MEIIKLDDFVKALGPHHFQNAADRLSNLISGQVCILLDLTQGYKNVGVMLIQRIGLLA